jgi:mannose-6-phosphate isomerase-like protein (cupin superfamily)
MSFHKISTNDIEPYVTKDGSLIREIIRPSRLEDARMSLAEATLKEGCSTFLHIHRTSEEIYHILSGKGAMTLGDEKFDVEPGDSIFIMPGTPHRIENLGDRPLRILCCCYPPYEHEDTEIVDKTTGVRR